MKRTLALLLIICLSFGLVACGKAGNDSYFTPAGTPTKAPITHTTTPITNRPTEAPTPTASHLHNYSENVIREVGCTTHGIILYTCSCSESYTDKIPATGHRWNSWRTVEKATELTEGLSQRTCKYCTEKETRTIEKLPPLEVTDEQLRRIEEGVLKYINSNRSRNGVAPLTINSHLDDVAQLRVSEINTFGAHRPDGESVTALVDQNIYPYSALRENYCHMSHAGNDYRVFSVDHWAGTDLQIEAVARETFGYFCLRPVDYEALCNGDYTDIGIGISYAAWWKNPVIPMFTFVYILGSK